MMTRTTPSLFPIAVIALAGLAIGPIAHAQDALGSGDSLGAGNALDANPQVGSGGVNSITRDWQSEIAFRNAIVTGNVGGGREFRGNVGYTGINDFRGALGSDLVYNFQRDSFYSGLAARKVRGIEATALQLQGPMGGLRDGVSGLGAGLIIDRPGSGVQSGRITRSPNAGSNDLDNLLAFDRINTTLRSTTAYAVRDATRPQIVGSATDGSNNYYLTASPLGGVDALSPLDPALVSGRSYSPEQFDFDPRIAIPGYREQAIRDRQLLDQIEDAEIAAQRMPGHAKILNDLREEAVLRGVIEPEVRTEAETDTRTEQPTGAPPAPEGPGSNNPGSNLPGIDFPDLEGTTPGSAFDDSQISGQGEGSVVAVDELDRLLRGFSRELETRPDPLGPTGQSPNPLNTAPDLGPTRLRRAEDPTQNDPATVDDAMSAERMDRMIALLRDQSTTLDRIAPRESGSLYAQHMRAGERLLGDGMWFIAEERFVAALTAKPGDAMAAIGRAHAQLGAGLYLSAAVNLADLLRAYPELAAVRYDDALLPGTERLERIREQLRSRSLRDDANARNAGFLLAYLGFQTERPDDVREGFAVVNRVNEALEVKTDPLVPVLAELWSEPAKRKQSTEDSQPVPDAQP